eukprot:CAMPEP_0172511396 /NCGR_PEP_ID=MMETSP1066-20121228/235913_1 /TAXON_ID=671091 /ORGANISM="Coscinodiscus wailesii, Strain CCMP2513" /LENGTH=143 /DNA_ID=CAMNT_0013290735 /DNA_START=88 /DNA_END=516 /DNA_ORIENTATION=+
MSLPITIGGRSSQSRPIEPQSYISTLFHSDSSLHVVCAVLNKPNDQSSSSSSSNDSSDYEWVPSPPSSSSPSTTSQITIELRNTSTSTTIVKTIHHPHPTLHAPKLAYSPLSFSLSILLSPTSLILLTITNLSFSSSRLISLP